MNNTLIGILDAVNQLLAFLIVVLSGAVGYYSYFLPVSQIAGMIIGVIAGCFIAGIVCGLIALLVNIEAHLRKIATIQQPPSAS